MVDHRLGTTAGPLELAVMAAASADIGRFPDLVASGVNARHEHRTLDHPLRHRVGVTACTFRSRGMADQPGTN